MYEQIGKNKSRTLILMIGFFLLLVALGYIISQATGQPYYFFVIGIGSLVYALFSYFAGAKMALAVNGAHEIQKRDNPRLYRIVENLAITTGMPMPKVYIMNDASLNAFAAGRDPNHSVVAATTGLLDAMNDTELEAVMAHEMGHVQNYDIRVNTIAFALVGIISLIADMFLRMAFFGGNDNRNNNGLFVVVAIAAAIIAPIAATMLQLAISRRREYLADATGALTTRYPEGLASALEKIRDNAKPMRNQNTSTAHMFFANPLSKKSFSGLFSTHPPVEERIRVLREMKL